MSVTCPNCKSSLSFSAQQQDKISQALSKLPPSGTLKIKCPKCGGILDLGKATKPQHTPTSASTEALPDQEATAIIVQPPPPPPLDWLSGGEVGDSGKVEDVPMALVLFPAGASRDSIEETLKALGYQLVCTDNLQEAQERMRFVRFACIVYQADMHGGLEASPFHTAMCAMSMEHRRHIFYILTGDELHTLYDLEAMAVSANLTVHSKDLPKLHMVLRKAFQAHEELFGPFLEELGIHSKV